MNAKIGTVLALWCATAFGQTFEAADVQASPRAANPYTYASGGVLRGGRYDLRKATMLDLIKTAWGVDSDAVFGGPDWLELDRFDVSAKAPPQTPPETIRLMLQALLRDRFGLAIHRDTRPMQAFALTAGKNKPKLAASSGSGRAGCEYQQPPAAPTSRFFACHAITMDAFAQRLRQMAGDYLAAPVVNETGLEGVWDFDVKWTPRAQILQPDASRTTLFEAVDQQLGLKLAPKTVPGPVLVVDRVNERPTPNPSDTAKILPRGPIEFEVAALKLSRPGEPDLVRVSGDRYEVHARSPGILLYDAFDVPFSSEYDLIAGIPKSVLDERIDITAKLPAGTSGPAGNAFTDDLRLMLRNLLIERFGIKWHYEDRTVSAYTLVAGKQKMKKADPSHRSNCRESRTIADDPRDSNPRLNRLVACQNVTMVQFASLLQGLAPDYLATSVADATGLDGAWDLTLSFSAPYLLANPSAGESASDLNGAVSLQEAVNKQLGLKLEKRLRPVSVLVIDRMQEKPTEN